MLLQLLFVTCCLLTLLVGCFFAFRSNLGNLRSYFFSSHLDSFGSLALVLLCDPSRSQNIFFQMPRMISVERMSSLLHSITDKEEHFDDTSFCLFCFACLADGKTKPFLLSRDLNVCSSSYFFSSLRATLRLHNFLPPGITVSSFKCRLMRQFNNLYLPKLRWFGNRCSDSKENLYCWQHLLLTE